MANQPIIEAQYIGADEFADDDMRAEFDTFADEMRQSEVSDAWITVYRIPLDAQGNPRPNTKHTSELFREPLGAATIHDIIERVRADFIRAGETKIMVRVVGSQKGQRGVKFNKIFTVEKANEKPGAPKAANDSFSQMMLAMQEAQRVSDERFERMVTMMQGRGVASDPIDQMTKIMTAMGTMMGPMIAVMAGRPVTPATSSTDELIKTVTAMKQIQGLFGGGGGEAAPPEDESVVSIIKALAPMAGPALQLMVEGKRAENIRLAKLPAPPKPKPSLTAPNKQAKPATTSAPPTDTPAPSPDQEQKNMELAEMKKNLDTVCDLLASGKDPAEIAKLVLSIVPEEKDNEFFELIANDDYVNNMALLNPRVEEHRAKFEELRKALLAEYEPDEIGPQE